jgi:alpha-ribazole phosphatase
VKLWLLRHAPVLLDAGICYGASDVAANAALTERAARAAAAFVPPGLSVHTSMLQRTRQLGDALQAMRPDLRPAGGDARLNEMHFGQWELQPWAAVPRTAFDVWMADFAHHRFGGVENVQGLVERMAQALADARQGPAGEAVWITHAGVIRAVRFLATHGHSVIDSVDQWPREAPEPGGYIQITL